MLRRLSHWRLGLLIGLVVVAPMAATCRAERHLHTARGDRGMVVSVRADASRIGRDVLREGGNAVDAAVAVALALAVSWPEAGNLGGGGFMLVHPGFGREAVCIDYRETAPAAATEIMFGPDDGPHSHKIVGVPGTVRGLALAHQRFGKLPWRRLVEPAATLARQGVEVDALLAESLNEVLASSPQEDVRFAELHRVYGHPDGRNWRAGDRLALPELAHTLTQIAIDGPNAFYRGSIAVAIAAEMQRGEGLIGLEDLKQYQAKVRAPIHGRFRDFEIWGAPPPSSGGIAVVEALNILEKLEIQRDTRFSAATLHLLAETLRRVFFDRARFLGDPDFAEIPDRLTDKLYAAQLAESIDRHQATPSEALAAEIELQVESSDTTHFSVVDGQGMAVANTYTLEASWGSRIVAPGAGFVLNNEMGDFNWRPGHTDDQGGIGTPPNRIAPGKRMLSSQSPTIVTRDGRVVLVLGSPGGRTIISTVVNVLLNTLQYDMPLPEAVAAPRLHHQWFPDVLFLENARDADFLDTARRLESDGHQLQAREQGSVHAIAVRSTADAIELLGVSDDRRGGLAAGWESSMLVDWQFEEPLGGALAACRDDGPLEIAWSRNLAATATDGRGALLVRGQMDQPVLSFAPLFPAGLSDEQAAARVRLTAVLENVRLYGEAAEESLWIGFAEQPLAQGPMAVLQLRRQSADEVVVSGVANGPSSSSLPDVSNPLPLPMADDDVELAIEMAPRGKSFRVELRANGQWQEVFHGATAPDFAPRYLVLGAQGDMSQDDEAIAIASLQAVRVTESENP